MELTTSCTFFLASSVLFMMSKIQNLNGTHNKQSRSISACVLFMMSKIQNLNGTHNTNSDIAIIPMVVYDVKDTKFEWNSQLIFKPNSVLLVVYDVKDTKFEWNSQQ